MSEWQIEGQGGATEGLDDEELGGGMDEPGELGGGAEDDMGDESGGMDDDEELGGAV